MVCDYNADCVALDNSADPKKDCRCRAGFSGNGDICNGKSAVFKFDIFWHGQFSQTTEPFVMVVGTITIECIIVYST